MPHQSLKLIPGVDQTKTPALNEAAISESQLVRFVPDRTLGGLIQKLGGWSRYVAKKFNSVIRDLHAWIDTNSNSYLAVGAQGDAVIAVINASGSGTVATLTFAGDANFRVGNSITVTGVNPAGYNGTYTISAMTPTTLSYASATTTAYVSGGLIRGAGESLSVVRAGEVIDISPQVLTTNSAVAFSTTAGSAIVSIYDPAMIASTLDVIDIRTQVSVGGLVLYGQYDIQTVATNTYTIIATNILSDLDFATSTVVAGGAVPSFASTANKTAITVTLDNHSLGVGSTFPIRIATTISGVTLYGNYIVQSVTDANSFEIVANAAASATTTVSENSGNANIVYWRSIGPTFANQSYGIGDYGLGDYGFGIVPPVSGGVPITATDWTLDNWGEVLIASPHNGSVYQWSPGSGDRTAIVIAAAPSVNAGVFVAMPQRQIIAWGSTFNGIPDPLLIRWCDVNNYDAWTAAITNQAGSFRLPKGTSIVQGLQGPQQALLWTDLDVWAMQYVGPPFVYQFNEIGTGCGLIAPKAAGSINGSVYWMGLNQFFRLSGSGVETLRCPVWDVAFQNLDRANIQKIRFAANSQFGEIAWYFPVIDGGGENYAYVKYNILLDQWDYGSDGQGTAYVGRSAWINESVLGPPIGSSLDGYLQQHEVSTDADGAAMLSSFETGYFVLNEADIKMFIDQVWPDMKWGYYDGSQNAQIRLYFKVADYAGQMPITYGPYTLTQATTYVTPRFRGRMVSIRIESNDLGTFWRLGNMRYRLQPDGRF